MFNMILKCISHSAVHKWQTRRHEERFKISERKRIIKTETY